MLNLLLITRNVHAAVHEGAQQAPLDVQRHGLQPRVQRLRHLLHHRRVPPPAAAGAHTGQQSITLRVCEREVFVQVLLREFVAITGDITEEELQRAKTQLKSMLLMNLESRPVIFEGDVCYISINHVAMQCLLLLDCARQVLSVGHRRRPEHFISLIDKVSRDDLNRIGRKMLDTKAAVAAIGSLKKLPSYSDIEIGLLDKDVSMIFKILILLTLILISIQLSEMIIVTSM